LITVLSVIFVVFKRISYGPIHADEQSAVSVSGALIEGRGGDDEAMYNEYDRSLFDLIMPIVMLIGGVFVGILYAGGFYLCGGNNSFFEAFKNNNQTFLILCVSGLVAFIASVVLALCKKRVVVVQLPKVVLDGIKLMQTPIVMVILAAILGSFLRVDLHTGSYIAYLLLGTAPLALIPAILFITSLAITLTTGSAWGTFSLLIPITTEMLIALLQLHAPVSFGSIIILIPTLGALLSGASCGDHISPFSETTVMTSASTGVDLLVHARTQFYYALPVICGTLVAFVIAGYTCMGSSLWLSFVLSCGTGCGVSMVLLMVANRLYR